MCDYSYIQGMQEKFPPPRKFANFSKTASSYHAKFCTQITLLHIHNCAKFRWRYRNYTA